VGDDLTRLATVRMIGTTDPAQPVLLDINGDGFNDGEATANGSGQFTFEAVALAEGANLVRLQATNEGGTTVASRNIVLDTQSPSGVLVTPQPGTFTNADLGYVEVQWTDAGPAGLDAGRSVRPT